MSGPIELNDEERGYLAQAAAARTGFLSLLASYLPYLAPVALFGVYGIAIHDLTAVALAFFCLFGLSLWWIHSQNRSAKLFQSVCIKVLAAGRPPDAACAPLASDPERSAPDGAEQP